MLRFFFDNFNIHQSDIKTILDTKFQIHLDRATNEFVLMKEKDDPINYQLKILELILYVPVGKLSDRVSDELNSIQTIKSKPVTIQFRRIEIRPLSIIQHVQEFHSELLFTEDVPARIVICFVEGKAKTGNYSKNPFSFQRKWKVPKPKKSLGEKRIEGTLKDSNLEQRLKDIEDINKQLLEKLTSLQQTYSEAVQSKGKGRGKKSIPASSSSSICTNLQNIDLNDLNAGPSSRLREDQDQISSRASFISGPGPSERSLRSQTTEVYEDPDPEPETVDLFIKNISLEINGTKTKLFVF